MVVFRFAVGLVFALVALPGVASDSGMDALLRRCAPEVHPITMGAIVKVEAGGNYLVIGDDGDFRLPKAKRVHRSIYPASLADAVKVAHELDANGHVFGVSLGQVTNRNLKRMGVSFAEAFEPCRNLQLSRDILLDNYFEAVKIYGPGQQALMAALSRYNTGSFVNGLKNGYVAKVVGASYGNLAAKNVRRVGGRVPGWANGLVKSKRMVLAEAVTVGASVSGF